MVDSYFCFLINVFFPLWKKSQIEHICTLKVCSSADCSWKSSVLYDVCCKLIAFRSYLYLHYFYWVKCELQKIIQNHEFIFSVTIIIKILFSFFLRVANQSMRKKLSIGLQTIAGRTNYAKLDKNFHFALISAIRMAYIFSTLCMSKDVSLIDFQFTYNGCSLMVCLLVSFVNPSYIQHTQKLPES